MISAKEARNPQILIQVYMHFTKEPVETDNLTLLHPSAWLAETCVDLT